MKAMADRQDALERKVEQLEAKIAVLSRPPATGPAERRERVERHEVASSYALPSHLQTVRLGPAAPKPSPLATQVALKEPAPEVVQELFTEPAEEPAEEGALDEGSPLESALALLRTGDVTGGVRQIDTFVDAHPRHADAAEALFVAGQAMQNYGEPMMAVLYYQRVADDYPLSKQAPDAMLRMAACQLKLKKASVAREVLSRIMQRYAGSPAARTAESELKELERQAAATAQADAEAAEAAEAAKRN